MKAIVYTQTGSPDVLQLKEIEQPIPLEHQVLIKVMAASVNALDWHALQTTSPLAKLFGWLFSGGKRPPKEQRLGVDLSGRVEAVGSAVTQFHVGDEVFGRGNGAFAEYSCAREDAVVMKPASLSFEAAAAVPVAAITALQGLRDKGQIQPGQRVVIYGAGGGVGTFAVQIAKAFGAQVTAVCGAKNVDMARLIGADHVIDYMQTDFTQSREQYDLILAVNGYHPMRAYRRVLRPQGRFVLVGASGDRVIQAVVQTMFLGPMISRARGKKFGFMGIANPTQNDLNFVKDLIEAGKVTPMIDRCFPLHETADALRYMGAGHIKGKVVITVAQAH